VIPDSASRSNALAANDLDAQLINTPDAMIAAEAEVKAGQMQAITDAGQETDEIVLAMNTTKPPFDDPLARQALAAGIDQSQPPLPRLPRPGAFDESSPYFISKQDAVPRMTWRRRRTWWPSTPSATGPPGSTCWCRWTLVAQTFQSQAKELGMEVEVTAIEQTCSSTRSSPGDYQAGFVPGPRRPRTAACSGHQGEPERAVAELLPRRRGGHHQPTVPPLVLEDRAAHRV
jgi:hypothetical protein